jgi:hypothetical protein
VDWPLENAYRRQTDDTILTEIRDALKALRDQVIALRIATEKLLSKR